MGAAGATLGGASLSALEKEILEICHKHDAGRTDPEIRGALESEPLPTQRLEAYNRLLSLGRLQIVERVTPGAGGMPGRVVVYKWVSAKVAQKMAGLSPAERMAYQMIAKSAKEGQTRKDIKIKTNIQNSSELKGILERLTARNLIKEVKSVTSSNRRVYILAELEASKTHTGGVWYGDDQEFDRDFINVVYEFARTFIDAQPYVAVEAVTAHIAELGICNTPLSDDDVRKLMMTLYQDGIIEKCEGEGDGGEYYRKLRLFPVSMSQGHQPCFKCPIVADCTPNGVISPATCAYMDDWLETAGEYEW